MISPYKRMHLVSMIKGRKTEITHIHTFSCTVYIRSDTETGIFGECFQCVYSFSSIVKSLLPLPNALEYSEYFTPIFRSSAHELRHLARLACPKRMLMCECSEVTVVFRAASQCDGFVQRVSKHVLFSCVC